MLNYFASFSPSFGPNLLGSTRASGLCSWSIVTKHRLVELPGALHKAHVPLTAVQCAPEFRDNGWVEIMQG